MRRGCGCVKPFHSISCRAVAANEPHVEDWPPGGERPPYDAVVAVWFAGELGARPFNRVGFGGMFGYVEGVGS